jgi:AcrR family transcriptional regulator
MPKISAELRIERQEAILRATLACLDQLGYERTSMQAIASAAGLTKGGLYAYFESKEAILLEVAGRHMEEQLADFKPLPGESAAAQLRRIFESYRRIDQAPGMASRQRAILDLWNYAAGAPTVRGAMLSRYERYRESLANVIRRGQADGDFRPDADPDEVAGLILFARDGLTLQVVKWALPAPGGAIGGLLPEVLISWLTVGG